MSVRRFGAASASRRGSIFIIAMWVLVALVGLVLVMSRTVRVETQASRNRVAAIEAAAERAGEQYVLSQVEQAAGDAVTAGTVQCEAVPVGLSYFWVLRSDREDDRQPDFGIDDEGSKVNINTASRDMLLKLPGMTAEVADSIIDWRDEDENPGENGAESSYYQSLSRPYACKNAPFETTEELLLVKGMTPELLYGYDYNHNGLLDDEEAAASGTLGSSADTGSGAPSPRGLLPFITAYGVGTPTSASSTTGTGGTGTGTGGTGTGGTGTGTDSASGTSTLINVNAQNSQALLDLLRNALTTDRYNQVSQRVASGRPYSSVLDFFVKTGLTATEFAQVAGQLSTSNTPSAGLINVNTAPLEVIRCLAGIEDAEANALVAAREGGADTSSIAWVAQALPREKATAIGAQITGKTYRFSADVVGVSGDGKGFHRVRVVVDAAKSPPAIIYRRDLSAAGWPLPQEIRMMLRSGAAANGAALTTGNAVTGSIR
jgi:DNA uptake protein ComE-like DNA-binding protein